MTETSSRSVARGGKGTRKGLTSRHEDDGAEKQRTVRSALDSWSRTARLCMIYVVSDGVPFALVALWLARH